MNERNPRRSRVELQATPIYGMTKEGVATMSKMLSFDERAALVERGVNRLADA